MSGCTRRPEVLYQAMTAQVTTQVTPTTGHATLDPMTTASERPILDELDDTTGSYALEERGALRRVAGLSPELADITEVDHWQLRFNRGVLVRVWTEGTA